MSATNAYGGPWDVSPMPVKLVPPSMACIPTVWVTGPLGPSEGPAGMTTVIKATISPSPIVRVPAMRAEEV